MRNVVSFLVRSKTAAGLGLAALAIVVAGCAGASTPEVTNGDAGLELGRDIYVRQCASCHGGSGGGGRGTKLSEGTVLAAYPDIEDQVTIIAEGRNAMPAFGGRLTAEEIEAVVRFTREVLAVPAGS